MRNSTLTDIKDFCNALDDKKKRQVVFKKNENELFFFVRGNKDIPHFLKYYCNGISEWFLQSKVLSDIAKEVA